MFSFDRSSISRGLAALVDFFLPRFCPLCGKPPPLAEIEPARCPDCEAKIVWVTSPICPCCGKIFAAREGTNHLCGPCQKEPPPFARARAALVYEGPGAEAIKKFKYARRLDLLPLLQAWLRTPDCRELVDAAELLVPVPLHTRRLQERGFNQALLLAQAFPGKPLIKGALVRVRYTRPQSGLNPKERRENVRQAFAVARPQEIKGRRLLVVDDVYTTGATVRECARVLLKAGAKEVSVLTVARVRHE
jgi:ComF family protein|uniref:ComF family protein n=1 Tax=Desulfobacca acetoxidans TaxID=60893 RepID=A0A7C3WG37_9BACT